MAKLVKTYENDIEKLELTFRGAVFDFSMIPDDRGGRTGDKPAFDTQVSRKYPELEEDAIDLLENLTFEDNSYEILEILEQLEVWEES